VTWLIVESVITSLKRASEPVRHRLVRFIAPKLFIEFQTYKSFRQVSADVPRPAVSFMKESLRGDLVGAEIGVAGGRNARSIFETLSIEKLFLIDPYASYSELTLGHVVEKNRSSEYDVMKKNLEPFRDRVVLVKKRSHDAVGDIPEGLDFVYIDGNHDYDCVRQDIIDYYPKVRVGGCVSGHDFSPEWFGVVRAVLEYCIIHKIVPSFQRTDWWFMKDEKFDI